MGATASLPATMRAVLFDAPGGPEILRSGERPVPRPGEGEILIEVLASGLNGADLAQRRGVYPPPPGASDILGLEAAGIVAALGPGVDTFSVGDRVCVLLGGGGYAQYCLAEAGHALALPAGVDFVQGAALMETLCTVWLNVFELGQFQAGGSLLVHGGTSGIGTAAIQLAKLNGGTVWTTAGTAEKTSLCRDLGADHAINYREGDFAEAIREAGASVDVVLDMIGGDYFESNLKCLASGGRMIVIAFKGGRYGRIDLGRLLMRNIAVFGSTLRSKPSARKTALVAAVHRHVWPLIEDDSYRIVVDSTFAAGDAASAHAHMEAGSHMGKIVLTWD